MRSLCFTQLKFYSVSHFLVITDHNFTQHAWMVLLGIFKDEINLDAEYEP